MPKILIASYPSQTTNYRAAVTDAGFEPVFPFESTPETVIKKHNLSLPFPCAFDLTLIPFDLLLLPGGGDLSPRLYGQKNQGSHSPDYELDLIQFQLLQLAVLEQKPVLGICKGMQLINVFFGGSLCQHLPTANLHSRPSKDCLHPLYFPEDFPYQKGNFRQKIFAEGLFMLLSKHRIVNSAHHQGISRLGKNLSCIQYSEDYLPETILHFKLPILGLQWHPERLPEFCGDSFSRLLNLLLDFQS